ncbi:MAG: sulfite exporter TauE/SafE family protein [Pseudomonadota bacterium]
MPDALGAALATPGLVWLCAAIAIAGLVRGFTGFGTALIFVPVAGIFLPPTSVVGIMALTGMISSAALLPRAWSQADRLDVGVLAAAALVTVPLGLSLMTRLDIEVVRWVVAAVASVTLMALVTGWRFSGRVSRPAMLAIGAAAGIVGGLTGLTGPVVILFYLTGRALAQTVRANTILFLAVLDLVLVVNLLLRGALDLRLAAIGGVLSVPYLVTSLLGQALFHPDLERAYRALAYGVIALAVLSGLPLWS